MTAPLQVDTRALRDALGCFATGITVVTTSNLQGQPVGVTINSFNAVSLEPPLILFSLARRSHCLPLFEAGQGFAVHTLRDDQKAISNRFAFSKDDPWAGLSFELDARGCPLLSGVLSIFRCNVEQIHDGGDHRIIIGRVIDFSAEVEGEPLIYFRRRYRGLSPGEEARAEVELEVDRDIWMSW